MTTTLKLIASITCPFAQRSAIVLHEKGIAFEHLIIDLAHKPDWFRALSPLGKIPVLQVNDQVLFESAVINEYLDETHSPQLHPTDPLQRATNRAWIEFGSELMMNLVRLIRAADEASFLEQQHSWIEKTQRLEAVLNHQPFFNGATFALIDAAYAPLFVRIDTLQQYCALNLLDHAPKIQAWAKHLVGRASVQAALSPNFTQAVIQGLRNTPYIAQRCSLPSSV